MNGCRCSKCSSIVPLRCFLFIKKNATSAPITSRATIMPAMAPARNPVLPPKLDELLLLLECRLGLFRWLRECGGAVSGGGGGAGPVLQELPSVLYITTPLVQDAIFHNARKLKTEIVLTVDYLSSLAH